MGAADLAEEDDLFGSVSVSVSGSGTGRDGFEAIPVFRIAVQHPRGTGRVSRRWRKVQLKGGDCDRSRHGPPRLHEKTEPESAGERDECSASLRFRRG